MRRLFLLPTRPIVAAVLLFGRFHLASAKAEPAHGNPPSAVLQIGAEPQGQRLKLTVSVDGEPLGLHWSKAIGRLFEFVDADRSGSLDADEATRVPSAFGIRQMLWGQFVPGAQSAPPWKSLDADGDERVTSEELKGYLRDQGLTGLVIAEGRAPWTADLTAALLAREGAARALDEQIAKDEWNAAVHHARSLDLNGDSFIGPAELLGEITYPGVWANELIPPTNELATPTNGEAPSVVRWTSRVSDANHVAVVAGQELQACFKENLASSNLTAPGQEKPGAVRIQTAVDSGSSLAMWLKAKRGFESRFRDLAGATAEFVDVSQLKDDASLRDFALLSNAADLNGDHRLSRSEFDGWLDVQQTLACALTLVSVIDFGSGLFEFVDQSQDGLLSTAELADSWSRLGAAGCLDGDELHLNRLPHQIRVVVSRGRPSSLLSKTLRQGPGWFQASDRNGDGRLSAEEYPAGEASFRQLDANGDGQIGVEEVEQPTATQHGSAPRPKGSLETLGQQLFFDRSLSSDGSVSCADCHQPSHGWSSPERLPRGVDGRVGRRHPPSLYNVGLQQSWFWDGRATSLDDQVLGPIESPHEMNQPVESLVARLKASPQSRQPFDQANIEPSREVLAAALAAFCRTIKADEAPYDRFRAGDTAALSPAARRGHDLFFFRLQCSVCHAGENFTDGKFHNLGIGLDQSEPDDGRYVVTGKDEDRGAFKTPSLRNVAKTAPYMHDGRLATLDEVLDFYVKGGHFNPRLDQLMNVFPLTTEEKADVVTFLNEGLTSPRDAAAEKAAATMARGS